MLSQEQQIINELREFHSGKWVSSWAAVWNCETPGCFTALDNLVKAGIVEKKYINDRPFVRYIEPISKIKVIK